MTAGAPDPRSQARRSALQMLYGWELGRVDLADAIDGYRLLQLEPPDEKRDHLARALVRGTVAALDRLDALIAEAVHNWRIERLSIIDRLILRLAVYELVARPEAPAPVVIDEALDLARAFSTEDAVKFINGVLDAIRQRLESKSDE
ncbi:MAG: transcription antitermination factor NusB [Luteitalea sp.]|nr:transcription antitermination factor NusB [Luteitalea sp.]